MNYRLLCWALGGTLLLGSWHAAPSGAVPVYTAGHADIGLAYDPGGGAQGLELHYHLQNAMLEPNVPVGDAEYAPHELHNRVAASQQTPRPAGAQWDFLGTPAGAPLWYLPQSQAAGVPFLGFASHELPLGEFSGQVTWSLLDIVSRPAGGEFSLWQTDFFGGPQRKFDTQDGDFANDTFTASLGGHDHYNWGFTEEGIYELTFAASVLHNVHGLITTEAAFTFLVGDATAPEAAVPEPGSLLLAALGLLVGAAVWRRRTANASPA